MEEARAKWAPFAEKYDIHEETYLFQMKLDEIGGDEFYDISVEEARVQAANTDMIIQGTVEFSGEITDITIPSLYDPEGIAVTVYKPEKIADNPAILIYFHGGGLVLCTRQGRDSCSKIIATDSGSIVVNCDYRLLPDKEHPYAPFEDGVTVTRWVQANKTTVGGTESSKVGVGGDSSGGHISAVITNEISDVDFQVLIYPVADLALKQDSCKEFEYLPILDMKTMNWVIENSVVDIPNYKDNPNYNPVARTNPELSPPALFIVSELDPLVGGALEYAEKLRTAGVSVQCEILRGVPHDVFIARTVMKTMSAKAYGLVVDFLTKFQ